MAHIQRDPRSPKGVWYAAYHKADGTRAFRSTKKKNAREARVIAEAWSQAEREAANGELTRARVGEILAETLTRLGLDPRDERTSVKAYLEDWLEAKASSLAPASLVAYTQAVREFLAFLGEGANRRLESVTETDIERFVAHLRAGGRSASTINKLVRKYLSAPFERARRTGRIRYNPIACTSAQKEKPLVKGTFTPDQVRACWL